MKSSLSLLAQIRVRVAVSLPILAALSSQAQGTIYLSNLSEPVFGNQTGATAFQAFQTGPSTSGYSLSSVTLQMFHWAGNASGFSVSIRSNNNGAPGSSLAILAGDNSPETPGQYTYTASSVTLLSSTTYWIVAGATQTAVPGGYTWQWTASSGFASNDAWTIPPNSSALGNDFTMMFALNAIAVPEPSSLALSTLALLAFVIAIRLRR